MKRLIAIWLLIGLTACAMNPHGSKPKLVLMHGSHFDDAVWDRIIDDLDSSDRPVCAMRLPTRDSDQAFTIKQLARSACGCATQNSTFVAHSFAGVVVNQMVGLCPEKVGKIIYVTAIVPRNGETPFQRLSKEDNAAYVKAVDFKDGKVIPKDRKTFFKHFDQNAKDTGLKIYSEHLNAAEEKISYDPVVYARIPKYYVFASLDQIITYDSQKRYSDAIKPAGTVVLASEHFPMLSQPKNLTRAILSFL